MSLFTYIAFSIWRFIFYEKRT